jgi:hypothetical protein
MVVRFITIIVTALLSSPFFLFLASLLFLLSSLLLFLLLVSLILPVSSGVLQLVTAKCTGQSSNDGTGLAVSGDSAHLMTTESSSCTAGKGSHYTTLTIGTIAAVKLTLRSLVVCRGALLILSRSRRSTRRILGGLRGL